MVTREDELNEPATNIAKAIAKARQLRLSLTAYILSMALLEVLEATKAASDGTDDPA